jgi:hypothetical protein
MALCALTIWRSAHFKLTRSHYRHKWRSVHTSPYEYAQRIIWRSAHSLLWRSAHFKLSRSHYRHEWRSAHTSPYKYAQRIIWRSAHSRFGALRTSSCLGRTIDAPSTPNWRPSSVTRSWPLSWRSEEQGSTTSRTRSRASARRGGPRQLLPEHSLRPV